MSLETASYISQLVPANPTINDPLAQGQAHLQLLKSVLQASFPTITAPLTAPLAVLNGLQAIFGSAPGAQMTLIDPTSGLGATLQASAGGVALSITPASGAAVAAFSVSPTGGVTAAASIGAPSIQKNGNELLPTGVICMWSGSAATVPAGWYLCDGTNGTPNLQNQFIVAAGSLYAQGTAGGSTSVTLAPANIPLHSHSVSDPGHGHAVSDPGHTHSIYLNDPGHGHGVSDPGHTHTIPNGIFAAGTPGIAGGSIYGGSQAPATGKSRTGISIQTSSTGITASLSGASTGVSIVSGTTGITVAAYGPGQAFSVTPPYFALCYIMKA